MLPSLHRPEDQIPALQAARYRVEVHLFAPRLTDGAGLKHARADLRGAVR